MRIYLKLIYIFLVAVAVSSCARQFDIYLSQPSKSNTYQTKSYSLLEKELDSYSKEINELGTNQIKDLIFIYPDSKSYIKWNFLNNSNEKIIVNFEKTYYVKNNKNYAVYPHKGELNQKITNRIILPNETENITFYSPDLEGRFFDELVVAISIRNETEYLKIPWRESVEKFIDENEKFLGRIEYINRREQIYCVATALFAGGYCWAILFTKPPNGDYEIVRSLAAEKFNQYKNIDSLNPKWVE